jgi:2,4-dienoyl-CoA reductase-like NADH-dependent reductase (Old Yellow Enzyme family)
MCQYSSEDGFANDWHLVHLGSRAVGGAGLVIAEATAVSPEGRITPFDLGIWKNEHIEKLKQITSFIISQGSVPGIQLAHAGRKASHHQPWKGGEPLDPSEGAWQTYGPSAIPFKEDAPVPAEMTEEEIKNLIQQFKEAAVRALHAGFKLIEIHAAHGYLLHEFLSPLSNARTDSYGGIFENRIRIVIEIADAIRMVWPNEFPLFIRISATDWVENGWTVEDSIAFAKRLASHGVDLVDCSTGGNVSGVKIPLIPLYQVPFAEQVKKMAGVMAGAVGLINTAEEAASIISENRADLVFMARELLRDPYFPLHAARQLGVDVKWPDQYLRARR